MLYSARQKRPFAKNSFSLWALAGCCLFFCYAAFFYFPRWENESSENAFGWDIAGYYLYLPATFIYHDLKGLEFRDSVFMPYGFTPDFQQASRHPETGNFVLKYSSGQAVMMLPGFIIGHTWAKLSSQYPADGFSFPYQLSVGLWMLLYSFLGLFYLRRVLLHFFKDGTVAALLLIYCTGTNYLNYGAVDQMQTHSSLFLIYSVLMWQCIHFYQKPGWKGAAFIGALCGLATLIRPTDVISVLLPLLWAMPATRTGFKERISFFGRNIRLLFPATICFLFFISIQLAYWKSTSSHWVVYSYGDEGFSFLKPHFYDYLLSYNTGWLRYTPIMIMAFVGFLPLWVRHRENAFVITLFSFLALYIVSSWDTYDYGGSGGRAMVQYYPALAFPFAALIEWAHKKKLRTFIFYALVALGVYLNIWWFYHAHRGTVKVLRVSKAYFWAKIGRWSEDEDDLKLLDNEFVYRGQPQNLRILAQHDYSQDTTIDRERYIPGKGLLLDEQHEYATVLSYKRKGGEGKWLRGSAVFDATGKEWEDWRMPQLVLATFEKGTETGSFMFRAHRQLSAGERKCIWVDAIPPVHWDSVTVHVWNAFNRSPAYVDSLRIISFDH